MKRRELLAALGAGALSAAVPAIGQQPARIWRIGYLYFGSRKSAEARTAELLRGMRELGYTAGKNFVFEERYADGDAERLPGLVAELLNSKVDLIVATGTPAYRALQKASTTMPVIVTTGGDPVAEGLVASLSRPGGNITGFTSMALDVTPKLLELLVSAAPNATRVAVLMNPANRSHPGRMKTIEAAAKKARVHVLPVEAKAPGEIERSFTTMLRERVQGFIFLSDSFLLQQARQIADLAIKHRLPSIASLEYAAAGGLMGFSIDPTDNYYRAATYVDKILKGAKPADLPMQQPTKFELAVNMKTAKILGLVFPQSILLRADRLIE